MRKLSIIVPVYNVEQYVEECIRSIINEMTTDDELILINDGSKDSSLELCKKYESDSVRIIDNTNHGVSYTRNCGISAAFGEYIMFVDSDDYLFSGWRESIERGINTQSDVVYFSESGIETPSKVDIINNILGIPCEIKIDIKGMVCWNKLFRTEFLNTSNILFDTELINGEDSIFSLNSFVNCQTYSVVKAKPYYFYRTNNSSATHSFNPKFNKSNIKYIRTVDNILKSSDIISPELAKEYVEYITFNGLFVLAYRISFVDNKSERKVLYNCFSESEYEIFYNSFNNKWKSQKLKTKIYMLIKTGKYDKAIMYIRILRRISAMYKKIRRKNNGF